MYYGILVLILFVEHVVNRTAITRIISIIMVILKFIKNLYTYSLLNVEKNSTGYNRAVKIQVK